jgi:RiboL-PSP-HEPN
LFSIERFKTLLGSDQNKKMRKQSKQTGSSQNAVGVVAKPVRLPPAPTPSKSASGQPVDAHVVFKLCIGRANNLLKIHETAHGKSQARPEAYLADAHRAAIVLAISALDAYVRTCCLERIRTILTDKTKTLPAPLASEIKRLIKDDHLLEAARMDDLLSRVDKAFWQEFQRKSFQGVKNITDCLQIAGFQDVFHEVAISMSINEDNLKMELTQYTDRRHAIAHRGDYDLSQNPPAEASIRKKDAEDCIKLVSQIATTIHKLSKSA